MCELLLLLLMMMMLLLLILKEKFSKERQISHEGMLERHEERWMLGWRWRKEGGTRAGAAGQRWARWP